MNNQECGTRTKIININNNYERDYERDFIKIKFESDDGLPLCKILSILACIIPVGSVFKEDNNYYLQAHLHECLYEVVDDIYKYAIFV